MYMFFKKLLEKLHLTYKGKSIFTKFYWATWLDRRKHGFDITDTWNLDYTFAKFMVPRLLAFESCLLKEKESAGAPISILEKVCEEYANKGYEYDKNNYKFKNKKINDKVFSEAQDKWFHIVDTITVGFQDYLMEDDNYKEWENAWKETVDNIYAEINKCKNIKEKTEFLKLYNIPYKDFKNGLVNEYYLSKKLRNKSLELFGKYFYDLWW